MAGPVVVIVAPLDGPIKEQEVGAPREVEYPGNIDCVVMFDKSVPLYAVRSALQKVMEKLNG
jgi:hypothetical protein